MFKVLTDGCEPTRGSKYSACIDLYASETVTIGAGDTKLVGLGVAIDLDKLKSNFALNECLHSHYDDGERTYNQAVRIFDIKFKKSHYLQLMPRSSLRAKGLISNVGIIDLDFKDEIKIIIHNPNSQENVMNLIRLLHGAHELPTLDTSFTINKGDKIAQITLLEHKSFLFGIESDEERNGGFGSTGA